jgi:hypothetical protein
MFLLCAGCAEVRPPAQVANPVPIYLADYDVHTTVLLPGDGPYYIDYSFGDWNYAAKNHKWPNDALGALTISFESEFERRIIPADPHTGEPQFPDKPGWYLRLYADRDAVDKRLSVLTARFNHDVELHSKDGLISEAGGTTIFVKDTQHYSAENNCNHLTAATLRSLGYQVTGIVNGGEFHVMGEAVAH